MIYRVGYPELNQLGGEFRYYICDRTLTVKAVIKMLPTEQRPLVSCSFPKRMLKNMNNLVVWIWKFQESETNKCPTSEIQNKTFSAFLPCQKQNSLLPTVHSIFFSSRSFIFFHFHSYRYNIYRTGRKCKECVRKKMKYITIIYQSKDDILIKRVKNNKFENSELTIFLEIKKFKSTGNTGSWKINT